MINYNHIDNSLNFESISDFKWCMKCGGEVEFVWEGKEYCAFGALQKTPDSPIQICIAEAFKPETDKWYDTAEDALNFKIGEVTLRDIITKVHVIDRTI